MALDYDSLEKVLCDVREDGRTEPHIMEFNGREIVYSFPKFVPTHSDDERIAAADTLVASVNLRAYRISSAYFFTFDYADETSPAVEDKMRLVQQRNWAAYAELLPLGRIQKAASEYFGHAVGADEALPDEKIRSLLDIANTVLGTGAMAAGFLHGRELKTVRDITAAFSDCTHFPD
jgi:hypothetical protein